MPNKNSVIGRESFKSSQVTLYDEYNHQTSHQPDLEKDILSETTEAELHNGVYPWLIVLGTFLVLVFGLGVSTGCSQFQDVTNLSLKLSFVGTIFNILINLLGPLGQILMSFYGPRTVLFISIAFSSAGLLLSSFSTKIWHLYLTQGVLYGIGCSVLFYISLSIVPIWFVRHQGIALGIISSGISIGGLVMPLIMEPLNTDLGANWCYRVISLICFVIGLISCVLFKNNTKTNDQEKELPKEKPKLREMFDFSIMKNWRFILWCIIDNLLEGAYNVPYFFLPSYATHLGLTSSQGAIAISVASGMNALGRIITGLIADYVGHCNIIIFYSIISGLSCLFIWTYATTYETLLAFSVVFGFFGGAYITLTPTITLMVTGEEKFESGLSVFLVLTVASMFGPNLASAIEIISTAPEYDSYKYFTGACYLAGAVLLFVFKLSFNRNIFAKI